jgi:glycosyltransferase involved in cell wall biosynthesis
MITIGYSTRKSNSEFSKYLVDSSGFKKITVIEKINNGEKSLAETYNEILNESKTDIVVFCHDDIYFETSSWYNKIIKHFDKTDYGILGVAGTTSLPKSARWWEERKKMVGIVNHENNGKKWESKYSDSVQNSIIETIIVDGLFIAVNKKKILSNFNEQFKGFHFYDVSFCFDNYLKGVKIGVITNIRITHKSIGETNQQWEDNRKLFEETYKNYLPKKIPFDKNKKIKVLISCLMFENFTGSELYVFELAKGLMKLNCDVTILSKIGGPLTKMATKFGIKCCSFENPPGFKMGDGKWLYTDSSGQKISEPKKLYKIKNVDFDIIHIQHKPIAETIVRLYPDIEKIYTIHSEVLELEQPIMDKSIKKYIAIRPEIKDYLIEEFNIPSENIEIIYNPVDENKFVKSNNDVENSVLFVGTIDYLRKNTIYDLSDYCENNNYKLILVGQNKSTYLDDLLKKNHIIYHTASWDVQKYIKKCKEVAGIQLGRTTIEGWMMGKPAWIYNVDSFGNIKDKNLYTPPADIEKFYSSNVAKEIRETYEKILS